MSSDEIRRIVVGVEAKMGWTFRHKDVCEILQYTEQKARFGPSRSVFLGAVI